MTSEDGDEFTELVDADIPRVDLVGKGANGLPFLIAKSDAGVLDPAVVRDLVSKASSESKEQSVTISGSPAAIAAMIAAAPIRKKEHPMPDIVKADADEPLPDADQVADDAGVTVDGDPDDPDSPAWEAVDAARATQAIELAVALRRMVCAAQDREATEAATGDGDDIETVFDLDDVLCAIDCILSILAPFAVNEQAEADERQADLDGLMKGQVRKAGRVLSAANEQAIRDASAALERVLASLPAPMVDQPVAKSEGVLMDNNTPVEAPEVVVKAKGDPQVAVYTADGTLVGTVDQADLNPIAAPAAPDGGDAQSADDAPAADADDAADSAPADASTDAAPETAPAAPAPELTQPDANDGPAADDLTKARHEIELLKSALAEQVASLTDRLAKVEAQPMPGGPMLNGATPGADGLTLRGQTDGQPSELRKAWEAETNPIRRQELQMQLAAEMIRNAPRV